MPVKSQNNNAQKEYKYFLKSYLFPLLGFPRENNIEDCKEEDFALYKNRIVFLEGDYIYFCNANTPLFKLYYPRGLSDDNLSLAINILQAFFKVSNYRMDAKANSLHHTYYSDVQKNANYKMAIQKGICNWIVGQNNSHLEELFECLETWSVQTYEGKKVTLGFIINPDAQSTFDTSYGSWCDFLKDDFSAVFTDCIHTVIELDHDCNFCNYLSITENNHMDEHSLSYNSAFRFSLILQKYVTGNRIGVFLLNNGDIILSKNAAIKLVKRNLKWLNFSYDAFKNSFGNFISENHIEETLLQHIFASMLDVSFSHTGGIISLANDMNDLLVSKNNNPPILNPCEYLLSDEPNKQIESRLRKQGITRQDELSKRMLKRTVLSTIINNQNFCDLDRKLRCELISLDGACIINSEGAVCACGAIIKNDSGSSGGGRGAASKKLSNYGFAIKISTDGYIELYIKGEQKYSIK